VSFDDIAIFAGTPPHGQRWRIVVSNARQLIESTPREPTQVVKDRLEMAKQGAGQ